MSSLEGGCLCGRIRYTYPAAPRKTIQCHCTNCQKQSGSAFSINLAINTADLQIDKSLLSQYIDKGSSGNPVYRYFCQVCGSPLLTGNADLSQTAVLKAGTLDDYSQVKPDMSIWETSKQPWVPLCDEVIHFAKNPG